MIRFISAIVEISLRPCRIAARGRGTERQENFLPLSLVDGRAPAKRLPVPFFEPGLVRGQKSRLLIARARVFCARMFSERDGTAGWAMGWPVEESADIVSSVRRAAWACSRPLSGGCQCLPRARCRRQFSGAPQPRGEVVTTRVSARGETACCPIGFAPIRSLQPAMLVATDQNARGIRG